MRGLFAWIASLVLLGACGGNGGTAVSSADADAGLVSGAPGAGNVLIADPDVAARSVTMGCQRDDSNSPSDPAGKPERFEQRVRFDPATLVFSVNDALVSLGLFIWDTSVSEWQAVGAGELGGAMLNSVAKLAPDYTPVYFRRKLSWDDGRVEQVECYPGL